MVSVWASILSFAIVFQSQSLPEPSALGRNALDARERYSTIQLTLTMLMEGTVDGKSEAETQTAMVFYSKAGGIRIESSDALEVSDGQTTWVYSNADNEYRKYRGLPTRTYDGLHVASILAGLLPLDLQNFPRTVRDEAVIVAGERREAWVVEFQAAPFDLDAKVSVPFTIWVDKEWGIVLKGTFQRTFTTQENGKSTQVAVRMRWEADPITVNSPIEKSLFTFTPPPGAREVSRLAIDEETGNQSAGNSSTPAAQNRHFGWATTPPSAPPIEQPEYTPEAKQAGIEGAVLLSTIVHTDGSVEVLGVAKSLGYGLDEKAIEAAKKMRFTPAVREGKPIDLKMTLQIRFSLSALK